MRAPLVLAGAGGFARETAELVAAINDDAPTWELLGFLDDDPARHGTTIDGVPVLGPLDWLQANEASVAICIGNPRDFTPKARIVARLDLPTERYATLLHPSTILPASVQVGHGTVIHALCAATGYATIGDHVAVMPATVFTHDDVVGDFVTIGAGVRLAGNVRVGTGAYLGAGALIREDRSIGEWSLIGMGSVVTHDVPAHQVWTGVPATFLRSTQSPGVPQ
jgi:sugar O-acyltransferase (sialic acid O-acetyltransferase NeuD family)